MVFDKKAAGGCELEEDDAFPEEDAAFGEEGREFMLTGVKIICRKLAKNLR